MRSPSRTPTTCRSTLRARTALLALVVLLPGIVADAHAQEFEWFFDIHTGFRTSGVAAADFDRDGDADLAFAVGEHWPMPTLVHINDGRGNFHEMQRLLGRDRKGQAVGTADVNGDGWMDLVLVTEIGDRNVVFLNDGAGRLIHGWRLGPVTDNGRDLALTDLDRDGRIDLVVVNRGQANRAYRNVGADGFEPWFDLGDERGATIDVAAADLNGDGWTDIITADWSGGNSGVHVWINDRTGRLRHGGRYGSPTESVRGAELGDLDGDGDIDIAVIVGQRNPGDPGAEGFEDDRWEPGGQDYVLLNDGRGDFPRREPFGAADDRSESIAVADLDADGDLDLIVGFGSGDSFYSYEGPGKEFWFDRATPGWHGAIYINDGDLRFRRASHFNAHASGLKQILPVDVNGDGHLDLAVAGGAGISPVFLNSLGPHVGRWQAPPSP